MLPRGATVISKYRLWVIARKVSALTGNFIAFYPRKSNLWMHLHTWRCSGRAGNITHLPELLSREIKKLRENSETLGLLPAIYYYFFLMRNR